MLAHLKRKAAAAFLGEHTLVTFCSMTKVVSQNHTNTNTYRERFLRITHRAANHVRNAATITHIAKPPLPAFKVSQDGKMPTWIRRLGVFWFRRASYQPSLHWNCLQKDQLLQRTLFSRRQLTNCFIAQGRGNITDLSKYCNLTNQKMGSIQNFYLACETRGQGLKMHELKELLSQ